MYGKNLTFRADRVAGCQCARILNLIEQGKIDTTMLITHTYHLKDIAVAYELFKQRHDGVTKVAVDTNLETCVVLTVLGFVLVGKVTANVLQTNTGLLTKTQ